MLIVTEIASILNCFNMEIEINTLYSVQEGTIAIALGTSPQMVVDAKKNWPNHCQPFMPISDHHYQPFFLNNQLSQFETSCPSIRSEQDLPVRPLGGSPSAQSLNLTFTRPDMGELPSAVCFNVQLGCTFVNDDVSYLGFYFVFHNCTGTYVPSSIFNLNGGRVILIVCMSLFVQTLHSKQESPPYT